MTFMDMSVIVTMIVAGAALCHCNVKVRILLTNGNIQHTITGSLGSEFKMEHTGVVGIGRCRKAFSACSQQYCRTAGLHRFEIGKVGCIECNARFLAYLESFMLQEKFDIVSICRIAMGMNMFFMDIGTLMAVACTSAQRNSRNQNKKYLFHSNVF